MACEVCKKPYTPSADDGSFNSDKKPHVCTVCGRSFSLKIQLKRHLLSHEGNVPYVCITCEKQSDQSSSYNLRLSKKGSFVCESCNKCFATKRLLLRHAGEHTLENIMHCDECGECFKNVTALRKHAAIHRENTIHCDECGECFKNVTALRKHAAIHRPKKTISRSQSRKESYLCQDCGQKFSDLRQYEGHCDDHRKYRCDACSAYFASSTLLQEHQKWDNCKSEALGSSADNSKGSHDDTSNCNSDEKKHVCAVCDKCFTRKSALEGHMLSHYEDNEESAVEDDSDKDVDFQCASKNDRTSEQSTQLCLPKLKICRSYPCEKCSLVCASKKAYNAHVLSHDLETKSQTDSQKVYACRVCKLTFNIKDNYKRHKTTHSKEEFQKVPYVCDFCGKVFSKKKSLKKHFRNHLDVNSEKESGMLKRDKKYQCTHCGRLFAGETCWRKHEARHLEENNDCIKNKKGPIKKPKVLICDFCNEDFTGRRHVYVKHKQSHTPEVCGICDARFVDRASLREHCKIHIGTEEGRRFLECSQKALYAKNGVVQPEPKVEYIYLVLR